MKAHHHLTRIMACPFVLTAVHKNPQRAWDGIRAAEREMRRIESLISSWSVASETAAVNNTAGREAVHVSKELYQLIDRSLRMSSLTCGAFDISGTLSRDYWNFNRQNSEWLALDKIVELQSLINYHLIELDEESQTVFLRKKGMKIGFGGIGKGYAANCAARVMQELDIENGLINASGDLFCWGKPPKADRWPIKIPDPADKHQNLLNIDIEQGSVVTSGSYENYTLINGTRYSHIINPRTATPVTHTKNATVICPDAEFGDALATALSVLPISESLSLVNQLNGVECIIIDSQNNPHFSQSLKQRAYA